MISFCYQERSRFYHPVSLMNDEARLHNLIDATGKYQRVLFYGEHLSWAEIENDRKLLSQ